MTDLEDAAVRIASRMAAACVRVGLSDQEDLSKQIAKVAAGLAREVLDECARLRGEEPLSAGALALLRELAEVHGAHPKDSAAAVELHERHLALRQLDGYCMIVGRGREYLRALGPE